MHLLTYRLHELDCDDGAANALWDDLTEAHPDLRALFDNIRERRSFAEVERLHHEIDHLRQEIDARDDDIARMNEDLEYQINRTRSLEIELHDATRTPNKGTK
jgi:uncharacterized membrane protein